MIAQKGQKPAKLSKEERAEIEREVHEISRDLAERKEHLRLMRFEIEKYGQEAKSIRNQLPALQVAVLGEEDAEERVRMGLTLERLKKKASDSAFRIATSRSKVRRFTKLIVELEERLAVIRKALTISIP